MQKGKLMAQGRTAEVFEYGENKILKLFKEGFPKAAIDKEFKIGKKLFDNGLPVPETGELLNIDNRWGIIYERIKGPTMMNTLSAKPWKVSIEAHRLAELHKSIQIPITDSFLSQKSQLIKNITASEMLSKETKTGLFKIIENLPDGNMLCHGDFHPDNIIITKSKAVVIDWMTAAVGDPCSDAARTSILFKFAIIPEHKSKLETSLFNFIRNKFFKEYLKYYIKINGINIECIESWEIPHAAARLMEWIPPAEKEKLYDFVKSKMN